LCLPPEQRALSGPQPQLRAPLARPFAGRPVRPLVLLQELPGPPVPRLLGLLP